MSSMLQDPWASLLGNEKDVDVSSSTTKHEELDIYGGQYRAQQHQASVEQTRLLQEQWDTAVISSSSSVVVPSYDTIDIGSAEYKTAEELEVFGLDHLKAELKRRGLKIGGTLRERALSLFAARGNKSEASAVDISADDAALVSQQKAAILASLDL